MLRGLSVKGRQAKQLRKLGGQEVREQEFRLENWKKTEKAPDREANINAQEFRPRSPHNRQEQQKCSQKLLVQEVSISQLGSDLPQGVGSLYLDNDFPNIILSFAWPQMFSRLTDITIRTYS